MANRKISDLTALTATAVGDLLPIVDISEAAAASKNKRVTIQSLFQGIPVNVGIGTASPSELLELSATTDPKIQFTDAGNVISKIGISASTALTFEHNGSERLRIDASGRLLVGVSANTNGGILQLSGGITFPATAVAASDPNTLDDYEEGTFTPAVQGSTTAGTATYSIQTGQYTKIGNRVLFNLRIIYTGGTGTGNLRVGGLPFTSNNNMAGAATSIIAENIAGAALYVFTALVGTNTTYVGVDQLPTGGGGAITTAYDVAGDIQIAGHYFV